MNILTQEKHAVVKFAIKNGYAQNAIFLIDKVRVFW